MATFYDSVIPTLINALKTEQHLLTKGEAFAAEKNVPFTEFLEARLAPDMWNLSQQVTISTVHSAGFIAKVVGGDISIPPLGPASLEDAKKYLAETIAILESVKPESINGQEEKIITAYLSADVPAAPMKAFDYALGYLTPQLYFHFTTLYAILRSKGVPIGKKDFISNFIKLA
ncbi:hypothetical protein F4861DRAFT_542217 [Xylaria intraflava]|nr:hypothetical protein F4861DRAFT_542217 [Xylaria intraflava]